MIEFNAHFDGRVLKPDEPVELPVGTPLRVSVETDGAGSTAGVLERHHRCAHGSEQGGDVDEAAWSALTELIDQSAIETGITDLAQQHDHYLYGTPKRD